MVDKDVTKGNYFPELKLAVEKKLESLDPNAILKGSDVKAPPVDPKALKEAQDEMNKFLSEVNSKTNKAGLDNKNAIFEDTPKQVQVSEAERTRSQAEKEKNKGNECMKAKEYDQAIEHYQKAISVDPSFHVVFGNMSQAYLNLKKYKDAVQYSNKSLEIDPSFTKGYYRRSKANQGMGNWLEAAKDLRRIVILEPENTEVQSELDSLLKKHITSEKEKKDVYDTQIEASASDKSKSQNSASSNIKNGQASVDPQANNNPGFKRLNIVEEDEEDEEEESNTKQDQGRSAQSQPKVETKPAQKDSAPKTNVTQPVQSQPAQPNSDKSGFMKELKKVQHIKAKAVDEIKKSMYDDALSLMKKHLEFFDDDDYRLIGCTDAQKTEYYTLKMSYHANMALCYAQLDMPKKVVEFSDIVIEAFQESEKVIGVGNGDQQIYEKTLMRKALALEKCEKFRDARLVYAEVRKMSPSNMMASQGVHRCDEYLEDRHVDFSPKTPTGSPSEKSPSSHQTKPEAKEQKSEPQITLNVQKGAGATPTQPQKLKVEELSSTTNAPDPKLLVEQLEKVKDTGNTAYKNNDFQKAYTTFSSIIKQIDDHIKPPLDERVKKLLSSVLSNRAMTCIKLKKFLQGSEDCTRVLGMEPDNPKVLHRRMVCCEELASEVAETRQNVKDTKLGRDMLSREIGLFEGCIRDVEEVFRLTKEAQYSKKKDELSILHKKAKEEFAKIPGTAKPVIQELNSTSNKEPVAEKTTEQKPQVNPKASPQKKPEPVASNLNIDDITLKALDAIINSSTLPNNASKFEVELKSFKSYYDKMWQYFKKFGKVDFLSELYAKRELETSFLTQILGCLDHTLNSE